MKEWKSTFGYTPLDMRACPEHVSPGMQRIFVKNNLEGEQVRLKFSNIYGRRPMHIERVNIGTAAGIDGEINQNTEQRVLISGIEQLVIEPGTEVFSDPVQFPAAPGDVFVVSIYINTEQEITCGQATFSYLLFKVSHSQGNNFQVVKRNPENTFFYALSEIQVMASKEIKTIACFGDSITHQGHWSSALALKLYTAYPGKVSVINCGVSGNRILHDASPVPGQEGMFGEAGVKRFERDVFDGRTINQVIVLEGINDIFHPYVDAPLEEKVSVQELIEGLRYYVKTAHCYNAEIFLCTILPFKGFEIWSEEMEEERCCLNSWIRKNDAADGYFDFDFYVRDAKRKTRMQTICDSGDGLHPSAEGGKIISEEVYKKMMIR
ncbi:MAG: hypothetical protein H2212_02680 [Ruminococcus sp.]|jgi:lysophospholipase L1-like esterase|nr:hypothetical protein [Ruminococcus sp.]